LKEIGDRLRTLREEKGIDVSEVQAETKIRRKYIEALEQGDAEAFPGEVYLKGFLRCYAEYLGLDGWQVIEEYKAWKASQRPKEPEAPEEAPKAAPAREALERSGSALRWLAYLAISLLLLAAFVYVGWRYYNVYPAPPARPAQEEDEAPAETVAETGRTEVEEPAEPEEPVGGTTPEQQAPGASEGGEPATRLVPISVDEREATYEVTVDRLVVTAKITERCWVRVVADGELVTEETLEAGTGERTWTARERLFIRAGYPKGLELKVNGTDFGVMGGSNYPRNVTFVVGGSR